MSTSLDTSVPDLLKRLPFIPERDLYRAVYRTVYLIVEHNFSLKSALLSATDIYPVRSHIEKYVRMCFPPTWFEKRARKMYLGRMSRVDRHHYIRAAMTDAQLRQEFKRVIQDQEPVAPKTRWKEILTRPMEKARHLGRILKRRRRD